MTICNNDQWSSDDCTSSSDDEYLSASEGDASDCDAAGETRDDSSVWISPSNVAASDAVDFETRMYAIFEDAAGAYSAEELDRFGSDHRLICEMLNIVGDWVSSQYNNGYCVIYWGWHPKAPIKSTLNPLRIGEFLQDLSWCVIGVQNICHILEIAPKVSRLDATGFGEKEISRCLDFDDGGWGGWTAKRYSILADMFHRRDSLLYAVSLDFFFILIPLFREKDARASALSSFSRIPTIFTEDDEPLSGVGIVTIDSCLFCLDVAESVAKLIPAVGPFLEGACGTAKKILAAVQSAKSWKDNFAPLATHVANVTSAIIEELARSSIVTPLIVDARLLALGRILDTIQYTLERFAKLNRLKYLCNRSRIDAQIRDLHKSLDNALEIFMIRHEISTTIVLANLEELQRTTLAEMQLLRISQVDMHRKVDELLGLMRTRQQGSSRTGTGAEWLGSHGDPLAWQSSRMAILS